VQLERALRPLGLDEVQHDPLHVREDERAWRASTAAPPQHDLQRLGPSASWRWASASSTKPNSPAGASAIAARRRRLLVAEGAREREDHAELDRQQQHEEAPSPPGKCSGERTHVEEHADGHEEEPEEHVAERA
jgi:hypothetical protein